MLELSRLEKRLNYSFKDKSLLEAALTHRSVRGANNERLEFLGDSILNFLIAEALFQQWPHAHEGQLSRQRSSLVNGVTLAEIAREFALGDFLRLGGGELKSGGQQRTSILADAIEAIIAAIYLDSDISICRKSILLWYKKRISTLQETVLLKDPKTRLQEYLQSRRIELPEYIVHEVRGEAHEQTFSVVCEVGSLEIKATGEGTSRRRAEQCAAGQVLNLLEKNSKAKKS